MKININGKDIELKISFKSFLLYEQITNKSYSPESLSDVLYFFFSVVFSSDKSRSITFDSFIDWLDDNPDSIEEFNEFVSAYNSRGNDVEKEAEKNENLESEIKKN